MRALLVWPLCWSLFWIGHGASLVVHRDTDDDPVLFFAFWFRTYQGCMGWSHRFQVWAEGGYESRNYSRILPWGPPPE